MTRKLEGCFLNFDGAWIHVGSIAAIVDQPQTGGCNVYLEGINKAIYLKNHSADDVLDRMREADDQIGRFR